MSDETGRAGRVPTAATLEQRRAVDEFFAARYKDLRRIASRVKRGDANLTLNPTALVNEAWLKLAGSPELGALSPAAFKAIAARAMRRILIDAARRRGARKRAGGAAVLMTMDEAVEAAAVVQQDVLDLDAALCDLERMSPRQAALVEWRYFGGLTVAELARLLNVSETTVERDWRAAKAWLKAQLADRDTPRARSRQP